ncbi:SMC5-SMC6 complex localization factor protein 2-like [Lingula anatina]|uniref:SMC5-SMC6 complex localization factor protein 2-like n=1 Tax=Lingula anatina TaxID=7574 RepID=A0A1S3IFF0_LINAN|nr:SMC5-SMC6 complex localization factor protein 2-like [Lingula anatina]|eukprot:XP_013396189.1 SMC5-SMC6 complex localization factor protein 2-like [Lingula anatina]
MKRKREQSKGVQKVTKFFKALTHQGASYKQRVRLGGDSEASVIACDTSSFCKSSNSLSFDRCADPVHTPVVGAELCSPFSASVVTGASSDVKSMMNKHSFRRGKSSNHKRLSWHSQRRTSVHTATSSNLLDPFRQNVRNRNYTSQSLDTCSDIDYYRQPFWTPYFSAENLATYQYDNVTQTFLNDNCEKYGLDVNYVDHYQQKNRELYKIRHPETETNYIFDDYYAPMPCSHALLSDKQKQPTCGKSPLNENTTVMPSNENIDIEHRSEFFKHDKHTSSTSGIDCKKKDTENQLAIMELDLPSSSQAREKKRYTPDLLGSGDNPKVSPQIFNEGEENKSKEMLVHNSEINLPKISCHQAQAACDVKSAGFQELDQGQDVSNQRHLHSIDAGPSKKERGDANSKCDMSRETSPGEDITSSVQNALLTMKHINFSNNDREDVSKKLCQDHSDQGLCDLSEDGDISKIVPKKSPNGRINIGNSSVYGEKMTGKSVETTGQPSERDGSSELKPVTDGILSHFLNMSPASEGEIIDKQKHEQFSQTVYLTDTIEFPPQEQSSKPKAASRISVRNHSLESKIGQHSSRQRHHSYEHGKTKSKGIQGKKRFRHPSSDLQKVKYFQDRHGGQSGKQFKGEPSHCSSDTTRGDLHGSNMKRMQEIMPKKLLSPLALPEHIAQALEASRRNSFSLEKEKSNKEKAAADGGQAQLPSSKTVERTNSFAMIEAEFGGSNLSGGDSPSYGSEDGHQDGVTSEMTTRKTNKDPIVQRLKPDNLKSALSKLRLLTKSAIGTPQKLQRGGEAEASDSCPETVDSNTFSGISKGTTNAMRKQNMGKQHNQAGFMDNSFDLTHTDSPNGSDSDEDEDLPQVPFSILEASTRPVPGTPTKDLELEDDPSPTRDIAFPTVASPNYLFSLDGLLEEKTEKEMENQELSRMERELLEGIRQGGMKSVVDQENECEQEEELLPQHKEMLEKLMACPPQIKPTHPGETIFHHKLYGQLYSYPETLTLPNCGFVAGKSYVDKNLVKFSSSTSDPGLLLEMLTCDVIQLCFRSIACPQVFLEWLFQLMAVHPNRLVSQGAYNIFHEVLHHKTYAEGWVPSLNLLTRVFINYGATLDDLFPSPSLQPVQEGDLRRDCDKPNVHFTTKKQIDEHREAADDASTHTNKIRYCRPNLQKVLQILTFAVQKRPSSYSSSELLSVAALLARVSLDEQINYRLLEYDFQVVMTSLLDAFPAEDWPQQAIELCSVMCGLSEHHHSKVHLVQNIWPVTERGLYLQRRLAYAMLKNTVQGSVEFSDVTEFKVS